MIKITPPSPDEYPEFYGTYIKKVAGEDLIVALKRNYQTTPSFISTIPEEKLHFRYQPGKWTIKELMLHVVDAERIFAYRTLRFARKDKSALAGFDENEYVRHSNANTRNIADILKEYMAVRKASIELFKSFDEEMLSQTGEANNAQISVKALGYTIAGHEIHHIGIIKERYLLNTTYNQ